jgi:23S rRNA-/tRNA-specific pseudouridylate synthase
MIENLLSEIAVGKRYKQKRKTLHKQCDRLRHKIKDLGTEQVGDATKFTCRNCGEVDCDGTCWGFHGLGRKEKLDSDYLKKDISRSSRVSANKRTSKQQQKEMEIHEIKVLKLSQQPSSHRDVCTSLRCLPPYVRVVQSSVKGKWCGKPVGFILKSEFADLSNEKRLQSFMDRSLFRVNNIPVNSEDALKRGVDGMKAFSPDIVLKNMDVLSRIIYWCEPPVIVPASIPVQKIILPETVCNALLPDPISIAKDHNIYCCDKPASVPVHPAGPYYQNTLLLMIEAQEGLQPRQLLPCHRLDRCTSGLTLCCTNPKIARLLQTQMDLKAVSKLYLARVKVNITTSALKL